MPADDADAPDDDYEVAFRPLFLVAFRAAHRILGDRHAAEDAAADALTAAHIHWHRIATVPHRDAWVVRVAVNRALDIARRRPKPTFASAAEVRFEDRSTTRLSLVRALHELPRRQREAVVLHMLVEFPLEDVARVLGITTASVRTHLGRGMQRLRARMGVDLMEEETCN
jgi:RNA polymerase sigma factor (sigma-70 family)